MSKVVDLVIPDDAIYKPRYHTKPLVFDVHGLEVINNRSAFDWVYDFTPKFLKSRSDFQPDGSMFRLANWQNKLLLAANELDFHGNLRYRTVLTMVARKNGKTELAAISVLMHLLTAPDYAEIYSAAVDTTQAKICFDKVRNWINDDPSLQEIFHVQDHHNTITNRLTGTKYRAIAMDPKSAQGLNPYFIVIDELHAWDAGGQNQAETALAFYNALISASGARKQSQVMIITTAGENVNDTILGKLYKKGIRIVNGEEEDDSFGFFCWEIPEDMDPLDRKNWYLANPNLAEGLISIEYLESMLKQMVALSINAFFRYHCNQWVRTTGERYISEYHWAEAGVDGQKIEPGRKVVAGFDGSRNADATGIVIQDFETGLMDVWGLWERDPLQPNWTVNREQVKQSFKDLRDNYDIVDIWVDETYWSSDLEKWAKELNIPMQRVQQSADRQITLGNDFVKDVVEKNISHTKNEDLTRHVNNAIRTNKDKPGKEKQGSRHKIDLLMCAIFANGARTFWTERNKKKKRASGIIGF